MSVDPVSLAVTAALTAGSMALQASRKIEGPRLDDLSVTLADYGTPLSYFYGIRRFEGCPIFWAEPLKEVKKRRKTKGGKYNDYSYYGTWATAIAGHEIDGVTRVWFDKHLVYDATGPGPISIGELFNETHSASKGKSTATQRGSFSQYCRFYLGTETQEPDPRMLATVEAEFGAGSCPAYRGVPYIMMEDAPLEKSGNRIPQIMVEAVSTKAAVYPYETFATTIGQPHSFPGFTFSPDGSRLAWGYQHALEIWDVAARSPMLATADLTVDFWDGNAENKVFGISRNGTLYGLSNGEVHSVSLDSLSSGLVFSSPDQRDVRLIADGNGREHIVTTSYGYSFYTMSLDGLGTVHEIYSGDVADGSLWACRFVCADSYGNIWVAGGDASDDLILYKLVDVGAGGSPGYFHINHGHINNSNPIYMAHYDGHFIIHWDEGYLLKIDDQTGVVVDDIAFNGGNYAQWANLPSGSSSIWISFKEISLEDFSVIREVNPSLWKVEDAGGAIYDPVNHALISSPQFDQVMTWRYLDRIAANTVTLQAIAEDIAGRSGMTASQYDFGALTQAVKGYSWTQGSGRDILEPLFDVHDSDLRPHDFSIQGVQRGGGAGATIDVADFVRDGDTRYTVTIKQDSDLPRALTLSFADINGDQQTNSVVVQRPLDAVDSVRELSINMTTMAEEVDTARQQAERFFRRKWFGAMEVATQVTSQKLALEPADVHPLSLDGNVITANLRRMTVRSDGVIATEWERDDPSIHVLSGSAGADMDGRVEQRIPIPGLTKGVLLDVPLAVDAHDSSSPFLYYGAAPYGDDVFWAGADFQQAENDIDEDYDPAWAAVSSQDAMDWGYASNALGDAVSTVVDNGNTLTVVMKYGTLSSSTEAEVLVNGALNLLVIGATGRWEYLQFVTATLVDTDTYALSGLLRGRRGTEQHMGSHALGDVVIPIGAAFLRRGVGASEIGDTDYYKAVSQGRAPSSAFTQALTFAAAANKPYSPVHGVATKDSGTGDWSITATRRTRIGGANIDGQDVPLGEASESWEADIMDGATVVRTLTGTSLPLTYTDGQQVTDWGVTQSSLDVNLYQMNPTLALRGFPLAIAA